MRLCGGFLPFAVLLWRCGFWWICGAFWQSSRVPFGCFARFLCTLGSVSALPGFIYGPLWAFILLCGFFFACGGFRSFWGLWCFAAFGLVSLYAVGLLLGIICPSFFRVPFGILCGFFSCHGSIIPGAGRRSRLPFSATGVCCFCWLGCFRTFSGLLCGYNVQV